MRLQKNNHFSLLETINHEIMGIDNNESIENESTKEEIPEIEEALDLTDLDSIKDKDIANLVIRYNQVVNRALRARFISNTRRKSL